MQCVKRNVVSLIHADESMVASATAWQPPNIRAEMALQSEEPELSKEEKALQQAHEDAYQEGLKKGHAEGHEKGYEEGYKQGLEKGESEGLQAATAVGQQQQEEVRQQADALFEPLIPLLEGLQNPLESQLDETVDRAIASLVVQIAREVIKSELSIKPEHVVGIVNNLFQQLPMTEREVRISLHPQDRALIESGEKLVDNGYQWKLESDEQMSRGGCRIDSPHFSADETVEQRLQQSVKQLFGDLDLELDQPTENGEQPEAVPEEGEEHGQESDAEMHAPEEAVAEVEEVSAASEEGSEPIAPEPSSAQQEP